MQSGPSLTPPKATSKTMPPQGSIASTTLRKHIREMKNLDTKGWGNTDLYYMSETGYKGSASLKTSHFAGPEGNHEVSPVRKRVRPPPYLMDIYYRLLDTTKGKKESLKTQTIAAAYGDFRRSTSEAYPHSMCKALLRWSTDAT
jgi:hypothetical protein